MKNKYILFATLISILFLISLIGNIYQYKLLKADEKEIFQKKEIIEELSEKNKKQEDEIEDLKRKNIKPKPHPIEIQIQKCMEKTYTTAGMSKCVLDSEPKWEKEIQKSIKGLKNIVSKETYLLILDSQKKWEAYRDTQRKVIYNTIWNLQGTMHINISHTADVNITEQRARDLSEILDMLQNGYYK